MTYLFKLARRLAFAHPALVVSTLLLGCAEAAPREFLGPDPNPSVPTTGPVSLHIAPNAGVLPFEQSVQFVAWGRTSGGDSVAVAVNWSATAGRIGDDGLYRGTTPGNHVIQAYAVGKPSLNAATTIRVDGPGPLFRSLTISPKPVQVLGGSKVAFAATARLQNGMLTVPSVTWSATGGSMSPAGAFEAGTTPGEYRIIATTLDGTLSDTAVVTVDPAALNFLRLSPRVVTMPVGGAQLFQVQANWSDGSNEAPELEWEVSGGRVVPLPGGPSAAPGGKGNGATQFEAGDETGTYKVIAKNPRSRKADTATVIITPTLLGISLTPESVSLQPGASRTFSASGRMSDGSTMAVSVSWAATGGNVSATGTYTAGATPGIFRVIARTTDGVFADTSAVTIAQPSATLTRLTLSPRSGPVAAGSQVAFTATALWSDGGTTLPPLTWSAQAGSITADGRWTTPTTAGSYRVIARQTGGTVADTVTIEVSAPTVAAVVVSPKQPAMQGGQAQQFTAQAVLSNGTTQAAEAAWSAAVGTITSDGRWTAPNATGTYRVVARQANTTIADTATIAVTETPVVVAIAVTPGAAALTPGGTVQFSAAATWSDGQARSTSFIWSATGGSITSQGLFAAGQLAGQFLVIATCSGCVVADTVALSITEPVVPPPALTRLALVPGNVALAAGGAQHFAVEATWSDGGSAVPTLTWSATGGTVSNGDYTAGATSGTYRVVVRETGGTLADTAEVTISGSAPVLTQLILNPSSVTLQSGGTQALSVSALWSDGSTTVPALTWQVAGGTLSNQVYTAGTTAGTFPVIVRAADHGLADTTLVTVSTSPTLTAVALSPKTVALAPGGSRQYSVTAQWSNGSTTVPGILWSATGGTITNEGRYTAPSTAGTYLVIIEDVARTRRDTSTVTVSGTSSAVIQALTVSPKSLTVAPSGAQQFAATALWSDGSTNSPTVAWSATGGTVTSAGVYTAPATAGTYRVIAALVGGTLRDTSTVTVQEPATPPAGTVYFQDSFDMGARAASVNGFGWGGTNGFTNSAPVVSSARARSGGHSLAFPFNGSAPGGDAFSEQRFLFGQGLTDVYLRFWLYIPSNYEHRDDNPGNNKFLRLWMDEAYTASNGVQFGLSLQRNTSGSNISGIYGEAIGPIPNSTGHWQGSYNSFITTADLGQWMEVQIYSRADTGGDSGVIRVWKNGTLVLNISGIRNPAASGRSNQFRNGYVLGWANSGFNQTTVMHIDDFTLANFAK